MEEGEEISPEKLAEQRADSPMEPWRRTPFKLDQEPYRKARAYIDRMVDLSIEAGRRKALVHEMRADIQRHFDQDIAVKVIRNYIAKRRNCRLWES